MRKGYLNWQSSSKDIEAIVTWLWKEVSVDKYDNTDMTSIKSVRKDVKAYYGYSVHNNDPDQLLFIQDETSTFVKTLQSIFGGSIIHWLRQC